MTTSPASPDRGPFELSAGALCLDFVNTWGNRERPEADGLASYAALLAFTRQTGALDPLAIERLTARATGRPDAACLALASAKALRESLYRILAGAAHGRAGGPDDLARLNAALRDAHANLVLERGRADFAWRWERPAESLAAPLWPIARSAAELLTSGELARVRECDGASCNWLFLDRSRGGSRRWCSMESCGNRAKARRHYRRNRSHADAPGT